MVKVLFRVDASTKIGLGHLLRSLSLALALKTLGTESLFLTNNLSSSQKQVEPHGFAVNALPSVGSWTAEDIKSTLELADWNGCRTILVDSHEVGEDYLAQLRSAGLFVIVRDDLALQPFSCQMLISGNADAGQLPYHSSSGDTQFLLGPKYIVLRPEYQGLPTRNISASVHNVLVILGGADSKNLMPSILNLLDKIPGDFAVTAVVGPFFDNLTHIQAAAKNANRIISLIYCPDSVHDLMLEADLAISAAGQTLYELACTGCPSVAIKVASNQLGQMQAMERAGFLQGSIDAGDRDCWDIIGESAAHLLIDPTARQRLSTTGQQLVDGQGAQRVAEAIMQKLIS